MHDKQGIQKDNSYFKINYFNFKKMGDQYLLTNDIGKFLFVNEKEFNSFVNNKEIITDELYVKLKDNYFIYDNRELFVEDVAMELREYKNYLMKGTQLHIFVLTTYCNLSCTYCQASANKHNTTEESKSINYMELRSPCGGVIGQLAYNYNGDIFTCDEGRMLAETGDLSFKLGDVFHSTFSQIFESSVCKLVCTASCLESIPCCEQCVYSPYCGVCPVCNYAQNKKLFTDTPNSYKCKIYKGILDILFTKIAGNDSDINEVFRKWTE